MPDEWSYNGREYGTGAKAAVAAHVRWLMDFPFWPGVLLFMGFGMIVAGVIAGARIGDQEAKTKAEICEAKDLGSRRSGYEVLCYDKADGRVYVPLK